jgi:pimeloyl-ACP methyl ester carboxylesterase
MRGYPPTAVPSGAFFDAATLTEDAAALIEALDSPAFVVGHDWGALAAYGVCAAHPELIRGGAAMAVAHPTASARAVTSYDQLKRSFYLLFFQLPFLPEAVVPLDDFAFIDRLWADWSPGLDDRKHIAGVKRTLGEPGALDAALGYYRALFDPSRHDPALEKTRAAMTQPIETPFMVLMGLTDQCMDPEYAVSADDLFTGPYERVMVPGAGHFLHREQPDAVNDALLRWFAGNG